MHETCEECGTEFAVGIKSCPNCSAPVTASVNDQPLAWRDGEGVPRVTTTGLPPALDEDAPTTEDFLRSQGIAPPERSIDRNQELLDAPPIEKLSSPADKDAGTKSSKK